MSYISKIRKYTIIQLDIVINIIFKHVITTNIDANISFMQFKIV